MDDTNETNAPGDDAPGTNPLPAATASAPTAASQEAAAPGDDSPGDTHPKGTIYQQLEDQVHQQMDQLNTTKQAARAGLYRAAAGIAGGPMAGYNLEAGWFQSLYKKATGEDAPSWLVEKYNVGTPEHFLALLRQAGIDTSIPNPKDPANRYVTAASGGAAAGAPAGVEGAVSGVLSGIAGEGAKDLGANKYLQFASSVLGALSPAGARVFLQKLLQINPEVAQANIANVEATGGTATLGQAAGPGTNAQVIEDALAKIPGPAGVIRGAVARNNDAAASTINDIADNFNAPFTKNAAGQLVQDTLEKQTVPDLRAKVGAAYQARAAAVPKGTQIDVSGLLDTINEQAAKNPNFRQLVATDPVFQEVYRKLQGGAGWTQTTIGGKQAWIKGDNTISWEPPPASTKLAFEDADNLAQQVGQMVDQSYNKASTTNIVNGSLAQVNAQFRRDISSGISGIPGAVAADKAATAIYNQAEAVKGQLRQVLNSNQPEQAFDLVMSGAKDAENRLDAVFRGLPADQQNMVAATIMRRLGVAVPSKQNAAGEAWSSETFLSNWNKISEGSKAILLRNMPPEYQENLNQIAQYAENVRKGSSVYGNPSGTGSKIAQLAGVTTTLGAAASGLHSLAAVTVPHAAIAALGPYAGMYLTARVMTNPTAVRWLAASTRLPPSSAPIIAYQLAKTAAMDGNQDIAKLANAFAAQQDQPNSQQK